MIVDGKLYCECAGCKERRTIVKYGLCKSCLSLPDEEILNIRRAEAMKGIKLVKEIFKTKSVKNDKLLINSVNLNDDYLEIRILHWKHKWVTQSVFGSNNDAQYYEFDSDGETIFALMLSESVMEEFDLCHHVYHRRDKYESELLFKRRKKE